MSYMNDAQQKQLLTLAREAIQYSLEQGQVLRVDKKQYPPELQQQGASFVTLQKSGELRGCIGTLQAYQSVVEDVVEHAHGAAFSDPRFPRVSLEELAEIHIEISLLTPQTPIPFESQAHLLEQLHPFKDGLSIEGLTSGVPTKATFLPQVWESLPNPKEFINQLKRKAGLSIEHSDNIVKAYRYQVLSFEEPV